MSAGRRIPIAVAAPAATAGRGVGAASRAPRRGAVVCVQARAATYKWVDEKGVTHYTDKMPTEAAGKGSTVLDKQARPVKKIDPALTPEQIAPARPRKSTSAPTRGSTRKRAARPRADFVVHDRSGDRSRADTPARRRSTARSIRRRLTRPACASARWSSTSARRSSRTSRCRSPSSASSKAPRANSPSSCALIEQKQAERDRGGREVRRRQDALARAEGRLGRERRRGARQRRGPSRGGGHPQELAPRPRPARLASPDAPRLPDPRLPCRVAAVRGGAETHRSRPRRAVRRDARAGRHRDAADGRGAAGRFVVDLGSGDGRLVIAAAREFGARGLGVDIDAKLVDYAQRKAAEAGVAERATFELRDLFKTDLSGADVVTIYLLSTIMDRVAAKLAAELKPGTRVVTHDYVLPGWRVERVHTMDAPEKDDVTGTRLALLFLYVVPNGAKSTVRRRTVHTNSAGAHVFATISASCLDIDQVRMAMLRPRSPGGSHMRLRALAICGCLAAATAHGATFTVTNLNDAGAGSLRQAVIDANAAPGADTIIFDAGVTGTITLDDGCMIVIGDALTIQGPGSARTDHRRQRGPTASSRSSRTRHRRARRSRARATTWSRSPG